MKKLLIGCGVVVLLALGVVGWVAWRMYPSAMQLHERMTGFFDELDRLDAAYPFEPDAQPLDPTRFAAALDLRVRLADAVHAFNEAAQASAPADGEEQEPGVFTSASRVLDRLDEGLDRMGSLLEEVPRQLDRAHMGPDELAWCTRLLWATLERVDAGVGGEAVAPLRGQFDAFEEHYKQLRTDQPDLPRLEELIGSFSLDDLTAAQAVLAADPARVLSGMIDPDVDALTLRMLSKRFRSEAREDPEIELTVSQEMDGEG